MRTVDELLEDVDMALETVAVDAVIDSETIPSLDFVLRAATVQLGLAAVLIQRGANESAAKVFAAYDKAIDAYEKASDSET